MSASLIDTLSSIAFTVSESFDEISKNCDHCINTFYQKDFVTKKGNGRVPHDAWVVNVVAVQKGTKYPNRYISMSGDIDSRASDTMDFTTDAPGANDNASGMALVLCSGVQRHGLCHPVASSQ